MSDQPFISDEHELFSYLDEYLYANHSTPAVAGQDFLNVPFIVWLRNAGTEDAHVGVLKVIELPAGGFDTVRGGVSELNYPVTLLEHS